MAYIRYDLIRRRMALGINQKTMAQKLGVTSSYISKIERGHIHNPPQSIMEKIEYVLNGEQHVMDEDMPVICDDKILTLLEKRVSTAIHELEDVRRSLKLMLKRSEIND